MSEKFSFPALGSAAFEFVANEKTTNDKTITAK
jgi:hypothetical protein